MPSPVQIPGLYCLGVEQRMHASQGGDALGEDSFPVSSCTPRKVLATQRLARQLQRGKEKQGWERRWNKGDGCLAGAGGLGRGRQDGEPLHYFCCCFGQSVHLAVFTGPTWLSTQVHSLGLPWKKHHLPHSSGFMDSHWEALLSRAQCIVAIRWKQQGKSDLENICSLSLHLLPAPPSNPGSDQLEWPLNDWVSLGFCVHSCQLLRTPEEGAKSGLWWAGAILENEEKGWGNACQGRKHRVVIYRTWHSLASRLACEPADFPSALCLHVPKLSGCEEIETSGHSDSIRQNFCYSLLWSQEERKEGRNQGLVNPAVTRGAI